MKPMAIAVAGPFESRSDGGIPAVGGVRKAHETHGAMKKFSEPRSGGRITIVGATHGIPPEGRDGVASSSRCRVIRANAGNVTTASRRWGL